jgi:hypothetical protein
MGIFAMPFQKRPDRRRRVFLSLVSEIENGLRDAYGTRYEQGRTNQKRLAEKIGVHRSVIHRRLTSQTNLTIKSIADLVWGLDWGIRVHCFDPEVERGTNFSIRLERASPGTQELPPPQPISVKIDSESRALFPPVLDEKLYSSV